MISPSQPEFLFISFSKSLYLKIVLSLSLFLLLLSFYLFSVSLTADIVLLLLYIFSLLFTDHLLFSPQLDCLISVDARAVSSFASQPACFSDIFSQVSKVRLKVLDAVIEHWTMATHPREVLIFVLSCSGQGSQQLLIKQSVW